MTETKLQIPNEPKVSIVMPCLNGKATLETSLLSCKAQNYENLEVILVDNGSTDGSLEYAQLIGQKLGLKLTALSCPDKGANRARNMALDTIDEGYVNLLDADDQLGVHKLKTQVQALEQQPEYDVAYGDWTWRFTHVEPIKDLAPLNQGFRSAAYGPRNWQRTDDLAVVEKHFKLENGDFLTRQLRNDWTPPHNYLLRVSCVQSLQALNAFASHRVVGQDREYFTLAACLGFRFLHVPGSTVVYNTWANTQMTQSISQEVRVAEYREIFRRLQDLLQERNISLTPSQQLLLTLPRGQFMAVKTNARGLSWAAYLRSCSPFDQIVVGGIPARAAGTLENIANYLAFTEPSLWEKYEQVMPVLLRLCNHGFLVPKT